MKWDTVFFGMECNRIINGLIDYHKIFDNLLDSIKKENISKIKKEVYAIAKEHSLNDDDEYAEWSIKKDEHDGTYEMLYTNFLKYSFIVLVGLILEDHLYRLYLAVCDKKDILKPHPVPRVNIIENCRKDIEETGVVIDLKFWDSIIDFKTVRNCIVHSSGKITHSRENELRRISGKYPGLYISQAVNRRNLMPLHNEDDMLVVDSEYCMSIVTDIKLLFRELFKTAKLPTKMRYENKKFIFE